MISKKKIEVEVFTYEDGDDDKAIEDFLPGKWQLRSNDRFGYYIRNKKTMELLMWDRETIYCKTADGVFFTCSDEESLS